MKTDKLNYNLPSELIAQQPLAVRSKSRLLVLNRSNGYILDGQFSNLGDFLFPDDCLVLNDTKVLPARFFARRSSGAKLEGLFLTESAHGIWTVYLKGARKLKPGELFYLKNKQKSDFCEVVLLEKEDSGHCRLQLQTDTDTKLLLDEIGFPPLPPYIKRGDDPAIAAKDKLRYQTVYARYAGAVAAPTAGLHFTDKLIKLLQDNGIQFAYVTLHVGAGTFKPIDTEDIEDYQIHREKFSLNEENALKINTAKKKGGRIIPVGTTSTRVLETVATDSRIEAASDTTELFIKPGYEFKATEAMITNFHLPKSSLLALVAAFAGLENILAAYNHAIEKRYRFYSYGDAMLII